MEQVHNHLVITDEITAIILDENITIDNNKIIIENSTSLFIEYKNMTDYNVVVEIKKGDVFIMENYIGNHKSKTEQNIILNKDSSLTRFHYNSKTNSSILNENIKLYKNAHIKDAFVDFSNNDIKQNCIYELLEEGASAKVRIGILGHMNTEKNIKIDMTHLAPNTASIMENYGVSKDNADLTIDGIGRITKGQYGSSSHQVNKIIVFDDTAKGKVNPYLFIDEHVVDASHGASVGRMNEDHLYYLQSRGLSKKEAIQLVVYGYFAPVLDYITFDYQKELFKTMLKEKVEL